MPHVTRPILELLTPADIARFHSKVGPPDENGCKPWLGGFPEGWGGYGRFIVSADGRAFSLRAHRCAFVIAHGFDLPEWAPCCLHRCDHPWCVAEDHIWPGSNTENVADRESKGRTRGARGEANASAILDEFDVLALRSVYACGDVSQRELGKAFGVSRRTIQHVVNGKTWKHVPMPARAA